MVISYLLLLSNAYHNNYIQSSWPSSNYLYKLHSIERAPALFQLQEAHGHASVHLLEYKVFHQQYLCSSSSTCFSISPTRCFSSRYSLPSIICSYSSHQSLSRRSPHLHYTLQSMYMYVHTRTYHADKRGVGKPLTLRDQTIKFQVTQSSLAQRLYLISHRPTCHSEHDIKPTLNCEALCGPLEKLRSNKPLIFYHRYITIMK